MISIDYKSNIILAKFAKSELVTVPTGDEPQPSSLRKRFSFSSRCLFLLLLIVLILSASLSAWAENTSRIESATVQLTSEELSWLKAHPDIVLGYADTFEPEVIVNPDGTLRGLLVDFLDELNRRLGIRIGLRIDAVPKVLEKMQDREIDGILNLHPEYTDKLGLLKTKGYMPAYPVMYARNNFSIDLPTDMAGKKIAIIDKVFFSEKIVKQYGDGATILKVKGSLEGLQSVDRGDADLYIGVTLNAYLITKYHLYGVVPKFIFKNYPDKFGMAIRPDWPKLVSILNKGISSFSLNEIDAIVAKWIPLQIQNEGINFTAEDRGVLNLTSKEQAWLVQKHTVSVRVVNFPPYMILDENKYSGIVIDYLNLITKRTGVTIDFVIENRPWQEALESLKNLQGPDIITSLSPTEERKSYVNFSEPYFISPRVIFSRTDAQFMTGIDDLKGKTLAVPHGALVQKKVEEEYPSISLLFYNSDLESIKSVSIGKADAYIGNLSNTSRIIMLEGINNLKVSATTPFGDEIYTFGIRKDWPELSSIITKGLRSISNQEKMAIRNKYMPIKYEHGIRSIDVVKWVLSIVGVAFLVISLFVFWNRSLKGLVSERTSELETEIAKREQATEWLIKSESKYRSLVDNSMVGVFTSTIDGRLLFVNDAMAQLADFDTPELMMVQPVLSLWSDPKQREQMLDILQKHGIVTNYEAEMITNTGRHVQVLFSAELLGDTISGMLMDVTDIQQAKEALIISETNLIKAQEVAHIGSWNLNLLENSLVWTDENYRIFGIPKGTPMTYDKFIEIVHPEDREYVNKQWSAAIEGEPYDVEHRLLIDNEIKWVREKAEVIFDEKRNPTHGIGITQDITELKLAQLKIQQSLTDIKILKKQLEEESSYLREEITLEFNYKNIIGKSDAIKYVFFKVEQVSESDTNVLVLGETGTGKELVARAIHHNSLRKNRPLIKINCATLPPHLIESELFGHERGSFTSAHSMLKGRFEIADGSTIFLDEIGELPLELQAKLLRVLEDGEFERLGSTKTIKVDVRIIAATNRDLEKDVSEGRFRQDLWFRLNVFPITIPPLRERVEDIPLIVQYYLDMFNKKQGKRITSVPVKTMKAIQSYGWPGNVRELVNILERAVINTSGSKLMLAEDLRQDHQTFSEDFKSLYDMEQDYILKVLKKTHWKISGKNSAAEILGLNRGTLRAKMKKMDIHKPKA